MFQVVAGSAPVLKGIYFTFDLLICMLRFACYSPVLTCRVSSLLPEFCPASSAFSDVLLMVDCTEPPLTYSGMAAS